MTESYPDAVCDLDTLHYEVMQAMTNPSDQTKTPRRKATLRWDQWKDMPDAACQLWDKLDDDDKRTILRYHDPNRPKTQRVEGNYHDIWGEVDDDDGFIQVVVYGVNRHSQSKRPLPHVDNGSTSAGQTTITSTSTPAASVNTNLPPGHPQRMFSPSYSVNTNQSKMIKMTFDKDTITFDANVHHVNYRVTQSITNKRTGALVDRGANGGIGGTNVRKLHDIAGTIVDITGIENHQVCDIPLAVVAGVMHTNRGPIVGIFNNYAYIGKGRTIHSSPQLDHFGHGVNDKSAKVGGSQRITTKNGYIIPISISNGLPYISMRPPTDKELETLPHEIMTAPSAWDPSVLDNEIDSDDDDFYDALEDTNVNLHDQVDECGNYRQVFYNEHILAESSYLTNDYNSLVVTPMLAMCMASNPKDIFPTPFRKIFGNAEHPIGSFLTLLLLRLASVYMSF
jgi:hypothetical protein